jgi:hypothetical protein
MAPVAVRYSLFAVLATTGAAQSTQPTLWAPAVDAALAQTRDFGLDFDQPGFWAVVEAIKRDPPGALLGERPPLDDWRELLERPREFRGRTLTIEGTINRNRGWKALARPELGELWQVELHRAGQPLNVTAVFTQSAADLPLGATIRFTGVFVLVRQYYDAQNRLRQAALFVAQGPTLIAQPGPPPPARLSWGYLAASVAGGLLLTWLIIRRSARPRPPKLAELRASHPAPLNLADELSHWAEHDPPPDRQGTAPRNPPHPRGGAGGGAAT